MTDRTVRVRLLAVTSMYQAQLAKAAASTKAFATSTTDMAGKNKKSFDTLGFALAGFGAAVVGGLGVAGKAAIDFESSFAGVKKTVDATEGQFAQMASELRALAPELGVNVNELNAIAEEAGQLGIERPNIIAFTEVIAKLRETTNLVDAAPLARLMNIMQTDQSEISNLGSAVVALGNDGASTEAEIVDMAQGIAGAANIVGISEANVLGFANALSSLGEHSEAAGTSLSRVMLDMDEAVQTGGEKLELFAETAGMSTEEFQRAFEEDAAGAIATFIKGLADLDKSGGNVMGTLRELGMSDQRVRRAFLKMAGAGDLVTDSLDLGTKAYKDNNAMNEEFAKRMDTTQKKLDQAKAQLNELAITIGGAILPAIGKLAEISGIAFGGMADAINDLPKPMQSLAASLGGMVGVVSLLGGGFLLLAPRIAETKKALEALGVSSKLAALQTTRLGRSVGLLGKSLGALTLGYAAVSILQELRDAGDEAGGAMGALSDSLRSNPFTATAIGAKDFTDILGDAQLKSVSLVDKVRLLGSEMFGAGFQMEGAAGNIVGSFDDMAIGVKKPISGVEKLTQALREQRTLAMQMAGGYVGLFASINAVKDAETALADAQQKLNRLSDKGKKGTKEYRQAQDDLTDAQVSAITENINATEAIENYAKELKDSGEPQRKVNDMIREFGKRAGLTRGEVNALIAEVADHVEGLGKIPKTKDTKVTADTSKAREVIDGFIGALDQKSVTVEVKAQGVGTGVMLHSGGEVPGRGDVPAVLQSGEFVVRRSQAEKYAGLLEGINAGRMPPDYHSGGWVAHPEMMTDFTSVTEAIKKASASGPTFGGGNLVELGRWFLSLGARVSGHGAFGGTPTSGHATNSLHYCVPMDSEILTRDGWKSFDEVEPGDETLGYNPETRQSEWTKVTDKARFEDAPVVEASHSRIQIRCTPNHRWLTDRSSSLYSGYSYTQADALDECPECGATKFKSRRALGIHRARMHKVPSPGRVKRFGKSSEQRPRDEPASLVEFKDIPGVHRIRLSAPADTPHELAISLDEVRILAWALTDGWVARPQTKAGRKAEIRLYQKKPEYVAEIDELVKPYSFRRYRHNAAGVTGWYPSRADSTELWKRSQIDELGLAGFVLALGTEEREAFLDVCRKAEGCQQTKLRGVAQNEGEMKDAIELAGYLCGFSVTRGRSGVSLCRPHVQRAKLKTRNLEKQPVWCVTTELGSWTMRQRGRIMLTGNSNRAIDVNYGPGGASAVERAFIARHLPTVSALGPTQNLHPFNDPAHYDHWHIGFDKGGYAPNGWEGMAKLHKQEIVSPVPVMRQVVREETGRSQPVIVEIHPKRGMEGIERFIDVRVEQGINDNNAYQNSRARVMTR